MSKARRLSRDRSERPEIVQHSSLTPWLSTASLWVPRYITESAWIEHSPFAFWLVEATSPRTLVELGTHTGYSYFTFCQAVDSLRLDTQCYAVDTWKGDEHAGFYDEEVFLRVRDYQARRYARFSQLIRSTFDEAAAQFPDGVIDLLHIDGRHFYEDVRHDFLTWKPKLSARAIVVLHDINVRDSGFGVWKFWEELKEHYPFFEFGHGHGLGVIGYGSDISEPARGLFCSSPAIKSLIRSFYSRLGGAISDRLNLMTHRDRLRTLRETLDARNSELTASNASVDIASRELIDARQQLRVREEQLREAETKHLTSVRELQAQIDVTSRQLMDVRQRLDARLLPRTISLTPLYRIAGFTYRLLTQHRMSARFGFIRARQRDHALSDSVADRPETAKQADATKVVVAASRSFVELKAGLISKFRATIWPAATAARDSNDTRPAILMLIHDSGGGTEQHVRALANRLASQVQIILVKIRPGLELDLNALDPGNPLNTQIGTDNSAELRARLRSLGVQRIHLHHVFGFFEDARSLISRIGLPYDITIHDYMFICPRLFLYRQGHGYCGEPDESGCTHCLRQDPPGLSTDILWWRWKGRELIEGADRVICPSRDAAARIARYAPAANLLVVPHEDPAQFENRAVRIPQLLAGQTMRVVLLGTMTGHKGIFFLIECIFAWKKVGLKVDVTLIGESLLPEAAEYMKVTGPYKLAELPGLIAEADPHLIFYPQKCPETYSYTLSEGLRADVPLLVPDLGSFRERIAGREWCWLYDVATHPDGLVELMRRIRTEHIERKSPPPPVQGLASSGDHAFYEADYLAPILSIRASGRNVSVL